MHIPARKHKILLLNASNMAKHPIYSYAFIQVPAIARQVGIDVICRDLLDVHRGKWTQVVRSLVDQHSPSMILITLRNTDSLSSQDYKLDGSNDEDCQAYFPIERTKELIAAIRKVSDLQIVVGGFGFSLLPTELMHYLQPDFGVCGAPDGFLQHFGDILNGSRSGVSNLLYFEAGHLIANRRVFYSPLSDGEYTASAIEDMMAFYSSFPLPGFQGAPVEIMRGCCHSCVFCSEPHVAGSQVKYRDQSAVMRDIETLTDHSITHIYMISSELNPEGNDYILRLADQIHAFNQRQAPERKITWFGANYLLTFSPEEYERLQRSGFTGGWFDITALDDENARAMRTPYRNASLLPNLKAHTLFNRRQLEAQSGQTQSPSTSKDTVAEAGVEGRHLKWTMFLGNPATTLETIRNTLCAADQEGLAQRFDDCFIIPNIRVFDYEAPTDSILTATYSVTTSLERTSYNQRLPSFAYPPALLEHYGSEEAVSAMFLHIAETYLSTKYRETRNWVDFFKQTATSAMISEWAAELPGLEYSRTTNQFASMGNGTAPLPMGALFAGIVREGEEQQQGLLAQQNADLLVSACFAAFPDCFAPTGIVNIGEQLNKLTPYRLAVIVFRRWSTEQELQEALLESVRPYASSSMQELLKFCIQATLYRFNVQIVPEYKALFVSNHS